LRQELVGHPGAIFPVGFFPISSFEVKAMNIDMMMNPSKYGLVQCPHCHGYGSSLQESAARCTVCGGSGLVKAETAKEVAK
jgi:DNA-directed RNA polymerase subunit RPC12/RpoP